MKPPEETDAIDVAADKRLTSRSDYIRTAVLTQLQIDGVPLFAGADS